MTGFDPEGPPKRSFPRTVSVWFQQIRGPFLVLAMVLVMIGAAVARRDGFWDWVSFWLLMAGVTAAHAAVNLFNELSDYRTGIDSRTRRTPFSGGSGMMQAGATSPRSVRAVAYVLLLASALIGLTFCFRSGWPVLFFMISGGIAVRYYTSHLSKLLLGEMISGITLGTFVVLGVFYSLTRHFTWEAVFISIPPGILTSLLLFLNEFPDAEADRSGGRHHLVIHLGKRKSAFLYSAALVPVYVFLFISPWVVRAPATVRLSLSTLPFAVGAATIVLKHFNRFEKMVAAQALNTAVVILTDLLIAVGYVLPHKGLP